MRQGLLLWLLLIYQAVWWLQPAATRLQSKSMGRLDYADSPAEETKTLLYHTDYSAHSDAVAATAAVATNADENYADNNHLPWQQLEERVVSGRATNEVESGLWVRLPLRVNETDEQLLRLQSYNLLYNAVRQTYFQLHTRRPLRLWQHTVSSTLSAVLGFNSSPQMSTDSMVENVQLYDATSLRRSRFNPFNPTRILVHGWLGNAHANVYSDLVPAYLSLDDSEYNVFTVDWGRGAIADYITASYRVKPVGQVLAKFVDFLHHEAGMRFEDLQLIGFSMGAHIVGIAGKNVQSGRVKIIRALDPAMPFFRYAQEGERLTLDDADYVEVLHTSAGTYGFDRPLGHVDFYANWGKQQPGCFFQECSHWRAFAIFAESLTDVPKTFPAYGCDSSQWQEMLKWKRCSLPTTQTIRMGGDLGQLTMAELHERMGVYYLQTNANAPYGIAT